MIFISVASGGFEYGHYIAFLTGLKKKIERKMNNDGRFDSIEGQYFGEIFTQTPLSRCG